MVALLKIFIDMCLLRAAPQDLPCSHFLLILSVAVYFLVGLGISLADQDMGLALLSAGVDTGLMIGLAYLGLWIRDFGARFMQTVTALCGTGVLFELLSWPLVVTLQQLGENASGALPVLLVALFIWIIAVIGNILRHALELSLWAGIGISLLYVYTSMRVMVALHIAGASFS